MCDMCMGVVANWYNLIYSCGGCACWNSALLLGYASSELSMANAGEGAPVPVTNTESYFDNEEVVEPQSESGRHGSEEQPLLSPSSSHHSIADVDAGAAHGTCVSSFIIVESQTHPSLYLATASYLSY